MIQYMHYFEYIYLYGSDALKAIRTKLLQATKTHYIIALVGLIMLPTINGFFVADMFVPALPEITAFLAVDDTVVKLSITLYLVALTISQLFFGPLADRFGRRPMMLWGLIISAFGALLCILAQTIEVFLLGRLIQGVGMGAPMSLGRTIFSDIFSGQRFAQVAAYFSIIFALSPAIAPLFGSYMTHWFGWHSVFVFIFFYGIFTIMMITAFLPETSLKLRPEATRIKVIWQNYLTLMVHKEFMVYTLSTGVAIAGIIVYYTISPFLFRDVMGLNAVQYGWLTVVIAAAMVLGRGLNAILLRYFNIPSLVFLGNIMMTMSGLSMLISGMFGWMNTTVVVVPMAVFVLGGGFIFSNAMAAALDPFRGMMGGFAGALYGCLQIFSAVIASYVAAHVSSANQISMAVLLTILGLLGSVCFYYVVLRPKNVLSLTQRKDESAVLET